MATPAALAPPSLPRPLAALAAAWPELPAPIRAAVEALAAGLTPDRAGQDAPPARRRGPPRGAEGEG